MINSLCKKSLVSYERKSPVEHVLLRPGMYIGQVELVTTETWLYNTKEKKMIKEHIQYSPALLKIFDEILVNAADNRQRDKTMSLVEIAIRNCVGGDLEISVKNDILGKPKIIIKGKSLKIVLKMLNTKRFRTYLSLSDEDEYAIATILTVI